MMFSRFLLLSEQSAFWRNVFIIGRTFIFVNRYFKVFNKYIFPFKVLSVLVFSNITLYNNDIEEKRNGGVFIHATPESHIFAG